MTDRTSPLWEAEEGVLSVLLNGDPDAVARIRSIVAAVDFSEPGDATICRAVYALVDRGAGVDHVTVGDELARAGELDVAGGLERVRELQASYFTSAQIEHHASIIVQHAQRRGLADQLRRGLERLGAGRLAVDVATALRDSLDRFQRAAATSIPLAIRALDLESSEPVRWRVAQLRPAGEITLTVGDGGSFKSTAALSEAGAIAGGYPVWGRFASERADALIITAEDPADVVHMRLEALIAGHEWERDLVLGGVHIIADPELCLSDEAWRRRVLREVERIRPGYIVVDPWADVIGGDENSNTDARPVLKFLRRLARVSGSAVNVVHHVGKAAEGKSKADRIRGSTALVHASRSTIFLTFSDSGVSVEHLKSSRGAKVASFVLSRAIEQDAARPGIWRSARLSFAAADAAPLNRAEQFVIAQVSASPRTLGSTKLRELGAKHGLRGQDVSEAIAQLASRDRIAFEEGKNNAKFWYATSLPGRLGRQDVASPPGLPGACPAGSENPVHDPAPLKGAGRVVDGLGPAVRDEGDAWTFDLAVI